MPLVTVVIAIYNPNINWLKKQLISINNQTFKDLEIIICDDCPENYTDKKIFYSTLYNFKPKILRNKKNLGSTNTFELLTKIPTGKYIAYCDQDDIWEENKIEKLVNALENSDALLAYSDAIIIDENDKKKYDSIKDYNTRIKFFSGKNLHNKLLIKNFIMGCTVIIKTETAKNSIPFEKTMIHDHYLALYCSIFGEIVFIDQPLTKYRRHSKNQTGVFSDINNKKDYFNKRILIPMERMKNLKKRFQEQKNFIKKICKIEEWLYYRKIWWTKFDLKILKNIWSLRSYNQTCFWFEFLFAHTPEVFFVAFVRILKNRN